MCPPFVLAEDAIRNLTPSAHRAQVWLADLWRIVFQINACYFLEELLEDPLQSGSKSGSRCVSFAKLESVNLIRNSCNTNQPSSADVHVRYAETCTGKQPKKIFSPTRNKKKKHNTSALSEALKEEVGPRRSKQANKKKLGKRKMQAACANFTFQQCRRDDHGRTIRFQESLGHNKARSLRFRGHL